MYTLGTAGHVDHGKSTLVQALTGINPDRWEEEQRREMTIDLGFAWLSLPSGRTISLIDVPGHERFIKNMLAGVGGLDAVLLIIAADEGIQPQTVEHLQIIDLLGIEHGLVVLTKRDLVDAEWLELMAEEVSERLSSTSLAAAPLVAVSARSGAGLDELKLAIDTLLDQTPTRTAQRGVPRLPIDRVFTISGFGTVVTGTLLDGPLQAGEEIEIQPAGLRGRVRGIQTHQTRQELALPGTRVAINVSGIERDSIRRGDVLSRPGAIQPTTIIDVQLRLVSQASSPLEHNTALDLFVGAAEVGCHIALLDREIQEPGESGWVQLRLDAPVAAARGDRCLVRRPSPSATIGGGVVIDPHPARHRRFRPGVIAQLETLARGTPEELLLQALGDGQPHEWRTVLERSGLAAELALAAWTAVRNNGTALIVQPDETQVQPSTAVISTSGWRTLLEGLLAIIHEYHRRWPLRGGVSREEARSRLQLSGRFFNAVLARTVAEQHILVEETWLRLPSHMPAPTVDQARTAHAVLARFRATPSTPPGRELLDPLDPELLAWLLERRTLVRVSNEVYFLGETYTALRTWVEQHLASGQSISLAEFRDRWQTTRKYAQAFLEHLDEQRITRRVGDTRVGY